MSFAFFFPGQGSQSLGMMNGFSEQAVVKTTFDEASAALGQDLWAMINGDNAELIGQTVNTQPIMLAAGVATYRAYLEAGGQAPSVVAGHSLGEYTALVAAGALDFSDAGETGSPACRTNAISRTTRRGRHGSNLGLGRRASQSHLRRCRTR